MFSFFFILFIYISCYVPFAVTILLYILCVCIELVNDIMAVMAMTTKTTATMTILCCYYCSVTVSTRGNGSHLIVKFLLDCKVREREREKMQSTIVVLYSIV